MYDIKNINIGESLKKYRKNKHYSLEYVGKQIFKTKATVSKYEKNEIIPDIFTFLELCNILDINIESILNSISPIYKNINPIGKNSLYLYYLTDKKIITSSIELKPEKNNIFKAFLYNGIKSSKDIPAYYYEGNAEFFDNVIYMNFKNLSCDKLKLERVQIIINIPISSNTKYYNCFVTGLTPSFQPIIKRGLISTEKLDIPEKIINKLKISKDELHKISNYNSWILDTKLYDEFFYDIE